MENFGENLFSYHRIFPQQQLLLIQGLNFSKLLWGKNSVAGTILFTKFSMTCACVV